MTNISDYKNYKPTNEEIRKTALSMMDRSGVITENDNEFLKFLDQDIKDLRDFCNDLEFFYKDSNKYKGHKSYNIIFKNKKGETFKTDIGLPLVPFEDRYHIDLEYIIDSISGYTSSDEIEEKDLARFNKKSDQLWEFLGRNDVYWCNILHGVI